MDTAKILEIAATWWPVVPTVVAVAAAIAAITPTETDNKIVNVVLKVVNWLGLNVFKAKNADVFKKD